MTDFKRLSLARLGVKAMMSGLGQQCRLQDLHAVSAYPVIADQLLERAISRVGPEAEMFGNCVSKQMGSQRVSRNLTIHEGE